jgi:copper(I)-binding protein
VRLARPGALFVLLLVGSWAPARAQAPPPADVTVSDVWARATPAGAKMGAIYLTLESATGDRLVGAAVPHSVAGRTQIHETVMLPAATGDTNGGRMAMRQVKAIALPPGVPVVFKPGGYHVMLLDLKQPLVDGAHVPLTLKLARGGKRDVSATVRVE